MELKAGTILINKNQIALIYRDEYNDFSFPKGHLEKGESFLECAIRETEEEIKRKVRIIDEKEIYIDVYNDIMKCYYFLGYDDGKSDNDSLETHDLIWCDFDKVLDSLTYESHKIMWNNIKDKVKKYIEE